MLFLTFLRGEPPVQLIIELVVRLGDFGPETVTAGDAGPLRAGVPSRSESRPAGGESPARARAGILFWD